MLNGKTVFSLVLRAIMMTLLCTWRFSQAHDFLLLKTTKAGVKVTKLAVRGTMLMEKSLINDQSNRGVTFIRVTDGLQLVEMILRRKKMADCRVTSESRDIEHFRQEMFSDLSHSEERSLRGLMNNNENMTSLDDGRNVMNSSLSSNAFHKNRTQTSENSPPRKLSVFDTLHDSQDNSSFINELDKLVSYLNSIKTNGSICSGSPNDSDPHEFDYEKIRLLFGGETDQSKSLLCRHQCLRHKEQLAGETKSKPTHEELITECEKECDDTIYSSSSKHFAFKRIKILNTKSSNQDQVFRMYQRHQKRTVPRNKVVLPRVLGKSSLNAKSLTMAILTNKKLPSNNERRKFHLFESRNKKHRGSTTSTKRKSSDMKNRSNNSLLNDLEVQSEHPINSTNMSRDEIEEAEDASQQSVSRRKRDIFGGWMVFPGTKWCGDGDIADNDTDLGHYARTDSCCRTHDHCPAVIPRFSSKYGVFNYRPHSVSHCRCERKFRRCLQATATPMSYTIGRIYFTFIGPQCFRFRPESTCLERSWWGTCQKWGTHKVGYFKRQRKYRVAEKDWKKKKEDRSKNEIPMPKVDNNENDNSKNKDIGARVIPQGSGIRLDTKTTEDPPTIDIVISRVTKPDTEQKVSKTKTKTITRGKVKADKKKWKKKKKKKNPRKPKIKQHKFRKHRRKSRKNFEDRAKNEIPMTKK